ncbi:hypothetical protein JAAARDRAFT_140467 [Jaapia argillacea MUCL 33604]|uniref:NAD(P)-binding protein n=1 Tax=Jaapia argillacea MUCL 33604 TaxID=933084 RepID=A0A067PBY0_9AGAM|nr:hypothetical protein JAAARDRAFT_140467 [Jaapia argillacea MUCL 33604]
MSTLTLASAIEFASSEWGILLALGLSFPIIVSIRRSLRRLHRSSRLPSNYERVLILGASSGIGRAIAHLYASRGARVCIVSRREDELNAVVEECRNLSMKAGHGEYQAGGRRVISVVADFSETDDMVRVRDFLETEWRGLDTCLVVAGVSALKPLMAVAGVENVGRSFKPPQADAEGIQKTLDAGTLAAKCNYLGPLVSAVTLIPLLSTTSPAPSILLLSSLAATVPAPTRSIYASSKAASLMLYESLAIEHPAIHWSYVLPATVEGAFRSSAVDGGEVREADPNIRGIKREAVAKRCVSAIDNGDRMVYMPWYTEWAPFIYWVWPGYIEWRASKKYRFAPTKSS